ncbi:9831_t:CDS:2 [Gigaspora margarita]|uniref:9831_t:CDS:1 n=1 Tax=Gigaspora margarita TaxID=4874 RepID=A0ABN7UK80_GIGMA|nr:9831_t:CDS:2 [Gigaspora margarita]
MLFRIFSFPFRQSIVTFNTLVNPYFYQQVRGVTRLWGRGKVEYPPPKPFNKTARYRMLGNEPPTIQPQPDTVEITGEFTDNPFSQVINGQKNTVKLTFDNKGKTDYMINGVAGGLVNKDNPNEIYRNLTSAKYTIKAPSMDHVEFPYYFYSEFPTQEFDIILFVFFSDETQQFRGVGFNGTITVVDPEHSIFDLQLLFLYVFLFGIIAAIGYVIYQAFLGGAKAKKGKKRAAVKPEDLATATSSSYDQNWIPDSHLKPATRSSSRLNKKKESKNENE